MYNVHEESIVTEREWIDGGSSETNDEYSDRRRSVVDQREVVNEQS